MSAVWWADSGGSVNNSYSTGSVVGTVFNVGGLVGGNGGTINNSYSRSDVVGPSEVGGLVGENSNIANITKSYSTGSVTGGNNTGGFVGANNGTVTNSFWDKQTSGTSSSAGGTGKTTAEMKIKSTFESAGWDFSGTWAIYPGGNNGYPYLQVFTGFNGITVTSPMAGSSWSQGSTENITWASAGVTNVKIDFSPDGGANWSPIVSVHQRRPVHTAGQL